MDMTLSNGGRRTPPTLFRRWSAFFIGLALVGLFAFGLIPWLAGLPMFRPLVEYARENNIDSGALYYTEVEEASEAEVNMMETMRRHAIRERMK